MSAQLWRDLPPHSTIFAQFLNSCVDDLLPAHLLGSSSSSSLLLEAGGASSTAPCQYTFLLRLEPSGSPPCAACSKRWAQECFGGQELNRPAGGGKRCPL
jgi:hypothetical protein